MSKESVKRIYFKGNHNQILARKAKDEKYKHLCKALLIKYTKENDIGYIYDIIDNMYWYQVDTNMVADLIFKEFLNDKYTIEEQVEKFIKRYEENYLTGFEEYIG